MRKMRTTKSSNTCIMKTTSELFTAKICTKPSNSPELPNCRKHFEVRRCRVSVLNNFGEVSFPKLPYAVKHPVCFLSPEKIVSEIVGTAYSGKMCISLHLVTFSKMATQAKPLCSQSPQQNSSWNPGFHAQISFTTTPKP